MSEFIVINGHAPWCAYIRTLHDWNGEEPCDCAGWQDDEEDTFWDEDGHYVDGDYGW